MTTKRVNFLIPVDLYKKVKHKLIDDDDYSNMTEAILAGLRAYAEGRPPFERDDDA